MSKYVVSSLLLFSTGNLLFADHSLPPFLQPPQANTSSTISSEPAPPPAPKVSMSCHSPLLCSIGHGVVLSGSFLWWRATEDLSAYAEVVTKEQIINKDEGRGVPKGHLQFIDYQWDPGFNLRLGWNTGYDCWDLFFDWTWYRNTTSNSISARVNSSDSSESGLPGTQNGLGIYGLWAQSWIPAHGVDNFLGLPIQSVFPGPFAKTTVKWNLSYNTWNLELGKSFKTRANLIRPFFGLRGALIERKTQVHYKDYTDLGSLQTPAGLDAAPFHVDGFVKASYATKMNFWGLGALLGVVDEFKLPHGWSLTGQFFSAFFYGTIHAADEFALFAKENNTTAIYSGAKLTTHRQWAPVTNLQMRFGVDWSTCFHHQSQAFSIGAAWEQTVWFFHGYGSSLDKGIMNLGLGGPTATIEWKF